ncbi:MAG TPA: hypothetical protein VIO58_13290 [Candidatus Methanoperedens sp.]
MKWWKSLLAAFVFISVILILVLYFLPAPSYEADPLIEESNTLILYDIRELGIKDVLVDKTDDHVLVRYNEPQGFMNRSSIMAIAAGHAPLTERIIIQVFDDFKPKEEMVAKTPLALQYAGGEITEDEFLKSVNTSKLQ